MIFLNIYLDIKKDPPEGESLIKPFTPGKDIIDPETRRNALKRNHFIRVT
jgi:hypothetical protein|tara:strand:+ start:1603 stop:1752 length:150 start_codon:yes stop_codon:yes gene_type:complete